MKQNFSLIQKGSIVSSNSRVSIPSKNLTSSQQRPSQQQYQRDSLDYVPRKSRDLALPTNHEQIRLEKQLDNLKSEHLREIQSIEQELEIEQQKSQQQPNEEALDKLQSEFNQFKHKILAQQNKIKDLDVVQGKQVEMIETQEKKWKNLLKKLEVDYKKKIDEFGSILQMSEEKAQEFDQDRKDKKLKVKKVEIKDDGSSKVGEMKKQLLQQKVVAIEKLKQQEEIYKKKENELDQWVKKEQEQNQEIKKKEELIKNFKTLLDHMGQEKELITAENDKIRLQLTSIKNLFKEKLPQLGIDPNLFDLDDDQEDEDDEEIVEEEKQDEDNSTEVEDNQE